MQIFIVGTDRIFSQDVLQLVDCLARLNNVVDLHVATHDLRFPFLFSMHTEGPVACAMESESGSSHRLHRRST